MRLKCIDSDGDYYPVIKGDFDRNNLTLEAQSQRYQILLSKSNRLVALVKDGKIVYVFASRGMIVKVLADNEYLYMKTISKLYSYSLSTLELCEVANLWN